MRRGSVILHHVQTRGVSAVRIPREAYGGTSCVAGNLVVEYLRDNILTQRSSIPLDFGSLYGH